MTDEAEMEAVMGSAMETEKRIFTFPTSQIMLDGKKSSYYEVIHSCAFPACNKALKSVFDRIDMQRIYTLVNDTLFISETHKCFYKHMLSARFALIIEASYDLLAKDRI